MPSEAEITEKLWKSIKSDRTIMLELDTPNADDSQPMTALFDGEPGPGPLWIFSSADVDLVNEIGAGADAKAQFASKGHDIFAALAGRLTIQTDRNVIDRLWSPFVPPGTRRARTIPSSVS